MKKCLKFSGSGVNLIPGTGYDVMFFVYFTIRGLGPCIVLILSKILIFNLYKYLIITLF
jgi:hypothetical protein